MPLFLFLLYQTRQIKDYRALFRTIRDFIHRKITMNICWMPSNFRPRSTKKTIELCLYARKYSATDCTRYLSFIILICHRVVFLRFITKIDCISLSLRRKRKIFITFSYKLFSIWMKNRTHVNDTVNKCVIVGFFFSLSIARKAHEIPSTIFIRSFVIILHHRSQFYTDTYTQ